MIGKIHPRRRIVALFLPLVALGLLLRWSRNPMGLTTTMAPPAKTMLVAFKRGVQNPGTARFDADAGTIAVTIDGRERSMPWSCPGFDGNVEPVDISERHEHLMFRCFRRSGTTEVRTRGLLDPENMTVSWVETSRDPSGKQTSARSLNLSHPEFSLERRFFEGQR